MWGVEVVQDKRSRAPFPAAAGVPQKIAAAAYENGLVCRAIGNTLAIAPPLIISMTEIDEIVARFTAALDDVAVSLR